ncbi:MULTISPECIES: hypothetical protein [unclassified Clostridium]|uniref:hypothetical protein n=1 Tax=unclassified Clostridium TaxID=2614128 RepID=UPI000297CA56|nr:MULTISPECIES: hypothetical protein [unclassified Clostridium]EKQ51040.1 MAG: hypothetical protein A370_05214 [Clostridium sp. Maddingley MBC34-26]
MKLKKTLAFIMTAALTVGTMAGCSQATLNYSREISNVAKWEATTSNIQGTVNIDVKGVKEQINIAADGYTAGKQTYVDIKFTDPSGKFNIPELKAYSDGTTSYINKSFYEGISALTGQAAPAGLTSIKEDYIGIDVASTGIDVDKIKALTTNPDAMVQLGKTIFGENSDIDIPFVQNGREYTINLDADKTVDLAGKAAKAAGNNIENINNTFKLGIPAEGITQIKAAVNDAKFDTSLADLKTLLAGSTISSKEVFADTSYNADFNMNLQIKDAGSISLVLKAVDTKSEVKAITFPTSVYKTTQQDFNKLLIPTASTATIQSTTNTVVK